MLGLVELPSRFNGHRDVSHNNVWGLSTNGKSSLSHLVPEPGHEPPRLVVAPRAAKGTQRRVKGIRTMVVSAVPPGGTTSRNVPFHPIWGGGERQAHRVGGGGNDKHRLETAWGAALCTVLQGFIRLSGASDPQLGGGDPQAKSSEIDEFWGGGSTIVILQSLYGSSFLLGFGVPKGCT